MSTSAKSTLDPVSFLFSQVLNQVDYLFERGYLTQNNYAAIAGALLQSSPPATPSEPASSSDYGTINAFTAEPRAYSMPTTASSSGAPPPPVQSHFESSGTILPSQQSPQSSKTSGRPSLLKFGNKSSKGKDTSVDRPLPQVPFAEADAPQLGRVNRRIRGALQGGFVLGQIVDQALALTPGVPESLRENIVERVEEGSRDYVQKATDPRNQMIWKENAQRAGSSAWKIARGGGGTSRASGSGRSGLSSGNFNEETGEFTLIREDGVEGSHASKNASTSSVHSFFVSPNINVTTVMTLTIVEDPPKSTSTPGGFAVSQPSPLQQSTPLAFIAEDSARRGSAQAGRNSAPAPSGRDPGFVSGRDW